MARVGAGRDFAEAFDCRQALCDLRIDGHDDARAGGRRRAQRAPPRRLTDEFESANAGSWNVERVNALIYAVVMDSRGIYWRPTRKRRPSTRTISARSATRSTRSSPIGRAACATATRPISASSRCVSRSSRISPAIWCSIAKKSGPQAAREWAEDPLPLRRARRAQPRSGKAEPELHRARAAHLRARSTKASTAPPCC